MARKILYRFPVSKNQSFEGSEKKGPMIRLFKDKNKMPILDFGQVSDSHILLLLNTRSAAILDQYALSLLYILSGTP